MEYGKIISGATEEYCNTYEFPAFVDIRFADTQPDGYLPVEKVLPKPEVPAGKWLAFHYTNTGTALRKEYFLVNEGESAHRKPKVYSTSDLIYALMQRGVYEQCRAWIAEQGFLDLVLATKEFTDDLENFKTIKDGLQDLLGYTDEQVAEVLAEAEAE